MAKKILTPTGQLPFDYQSLPTLDFSTNWNNKLLSSACTTIRLWNPSKYIVGSRYRFRQGKEGSWIERGVWTLIAGKWMLLNDFDDYTCYLDTGYSAEETRKIIKVMYAGKNVNPDNTYFGLYLFRKD